MNAKEQVYNLELINESINEIIQYKINKGYQLYDSNNIRPSVITNIYGHLINNEVFDPTVEDEDECSSDDAVNPLDVI